MGPFWIIIISLLVVVFGKFLWDRARMERSVMREGGMRKKFEKLISLMVSLDSRTRIEDETPSNITLVLSTFGAITKIGILMTFKTVTISYATKSELFGTHRLQWEFDKDEDQEFIFAKMNKDIGAYMQNIDYEKKFNEKIKKFIDDTP